MSKWKVTHGRDEAVRRLQDFVDWCAVHENHAPVKIVSVNDNTDSGGAIACQQCMAVFVLLGKAE